MRRALLVCVFALLAAAPARAHHQHAMSIRLHEAPGVDLLEVIAPTASAQAALNRRYAGESPLALDTVAGKERFIRYLKETVELSTSDGRLALGSGGIRVDAHQVVVRLRATRPGATEYPLAVHAPCLAENHGQLVTFRVMGERAGHVVLRAGSDYRATLTLNHRGDVVATGHADEHAGHAH